MHLLSSGAIFTGTVAFATGQASTVAGSVVAAGTVAVGTGYAASELHNALNDMKAAAMTLSGESRSTIEQFEAKSDLGVPGQLVTEATESQTAGKVADVAGAVLAANLGKAIKLLEAISRELDPTQEREEGIQVQEVRQGTTSDSEKLVQDQAATGTRRQISEKNQERQSESVDAVAPEAERADTIERPHGERSDQPRSCL